MERTSATTTDGTPFQPGRRAIFFAIFIPSFFAVVIGSAVISETVVRFVHLSLVYGIQPVAEGRIYFASTKPDLIVSNGDHLNGINHGWHFVAIPILWFSLMFGLRYLVNKISDNRLLKWKWDK